MDFASYLESRISLVDQAIERWLPASTEYPAILIDAMRYSLFAKGKRIRPILLLATAEAVCGEWQPFLPAACAIEMIHTYSLIHDDLPGMDNDDLRRGIPTNHKVFGEGHAILAGDALLTEAFYVLASADIPRTEAVKLQLVRELAQAAGWQGMIRGQTADLLNEGNQASAEMVHFIHRNKTGALLRGAVRMGAILGLAAPNQLDALTAYASQIGLAFQIVDDILDVEGETHVMGKTAGSDQAADKSTFVSLYGIQASKDQAQQLVAEAQQKLQQAGLLDASRLIELANFIVRRVW
ncbi:MAG: Polyprenyl synthetase [Bacilli bacterium]|nr:Polyprenyl synthetase [Bacilli bacterium]